MWLMGFHPLRFQFGSHAQNHILVDLWKLFKVKQALLVETVQGVAEVSKKNKHS